MAHERLALIEILEENPGKFTRLGLINELLKRGFFLRVAQIEVDSLFADKKVAKMGKNNGYCYRGR